MSFHPTRIRPVRVEMFVREAQTVLELLEKECRDAEPGDAAGREHMRRTARVAVRIWQSLPKEARPAIIEARKYYKGTP